MGRSGKNPDSSDAAPIKRAKARAVSAAIHPEPAPTPASVLVWLGDDSEPVAALRPPLLVRRVVLQQYFSALALLADAPPDLPACLVIDWHRAPTVEVTLFQKLKARGWNLPVIVLVERVDVRLVVRLMRAGAVDVLVKGEEAELLVVLEPILAQARQQWEWDGHQVELRKRWAQLTVRESEIVGLIVAGMLNKQIAEQLNISIVTVKLYRASAMRKLGARSAAELARLALGAN